MKTSAKHASKQAKPIIKSLHPCNVHNKGYDFAALIKAVPALKPFVKTNQYNNQSIDFADAKAVKMLNSALLKHHYEIADWDIPAGFLCPPIPGRVDYIHYIADLVSDIQPMIKLLDIGTGANGIYALLAAKIYGWHCVASDIDAVSLTNVAKIVDHNPKLKKQIHLRQQMDKNHIFEGIIEPKEFYHVAVCNPPFHASLDEALAGNQKKRHNLAVNRGKSLAKASSELNFGGQNAELWCEGGENRFLRLMINESKRFSGQCRWFTSLVSKKDNLRPMKKLLTKLAATEVKVIEMKQGNKITRVLVWTFLDDI